MYPQDGETVNQLVCCADEAMYAAKSAEELLDEY